MPPACPVVAYARRYPPANPLRPECHRLVRWSLTLAATRRPIPSGPECHRLVRWSLTLAATRRPIPSGRNATGLSGGRLRSPLPAGQSPPAGMPPACPVVAYARRYPPANPLRPECHRLVRWSLTLAATRRPIPSGRNATGLSGGRLRSPLPAGQSPPAGMPPACPVVAYARRYPPANPLRPECHRLVRWSLTLAATRRPIPSGRNATGLSGGRLRSPLRAGQSPPAGMPPACPVVAYARRYPPANPLAPDEQRRDPTGRVAVVFLRPFRQTVPVPFPTLTHPDP